jgi:hypothetical protein
MTCDVFSWICCLMLFIRIVQSFLTYLYFDYELLCLHGIEKGLTTGVNRDCFTPPRHII